MNTGLSEAVRLTKKKTYLNKLEKLDGVEEGLHLNDLAKINTQKQLIDRKLVASKKGPKWCWQRILQIFRPGMVKQEK